MWRADEGTVKVGLSREPSARQRTLGSNHVLAYSTEPWPQARRIERYAHALLHSRRVHPRREYFAVTFDEGVNALNQAKRMVEAGEALPWEPVPINLRVCSAVRKAAEAAAKRDGRCLSDWISALISGACGLETANSLAAIERRQVNIWASDEVLEAIAKLIRADTSKRKPPSQNEVVCKAILEAAARLDEETGK